MSDYFSSISVFMVIKLNVKVCAVKIGSMYAPHRGGK